MGEIRKLNLKDYSELLKIATECFQDDIPFQKGLKYTRYDIQKLFKPLYKFILLDSHFQSFGFVRGEILGYIVLWTGIPNLLNLIKFLKDVVNELRLKKFLLFLRYMFIYESKILRFKKRVRIFAIGVKESERGKGIAKELLRFADNEAKRLGFKEVQLEVEEINPARFLYLKSGYKTIKKFKIARENWWLMKKDL